MNLFVAESCAPMARALCDALPSELSARVGRVAASGLLAAHIVGGAPADLLFSPDRRLLQTLHEATLLDRIEIVAGGRLCLIVRDGRAKTIRALTDLARGDIRSATIRVELDPQGRLIGELFARAGLSTIMGAQAARGAFVTAEDATELAELLANRAVDAAIVFSWQASAFPDATLLPLPEALALHKRVTLSAGVVARNGAVHPSADAVIGWLRGPAGAELLRTHGFTPLTSGDAVRSSQRVVSIAEGTIW